MRTRERRFTLIELLMVVTIVAVIAAISIPGLVSARKSANEGSALGSLRTLVTQQTLFRESDSDADDVLDYATLTELGAEELIDPLLAGGRKAGYQFTVQPSITSPEELWFATADPSLPTKTGDRYFATNHENVVFYTTASTILVPNDTCVIPPSALPLK